VLTSVCSDQSIVRPRQSAGANPWSAYLKIGCSFDFMSASAASVVFVPAR
jgi:hypothetical protein